MDNGPQKNPDPVYTAVTMTVFTILFIILYILFYYSLNHIFRPPPPTRAQARPTRRADVSGRSGPGLDPAILNTFPIFTYSEVVGLRPDKGPLECPVCLSRFEEDETLRLIPVCNHVFHPGCVDPWLEAHTTCPYCRANLITPLPGELTQVVEGGVHESAGSGALVEVDCEGGNDVVELSRRDIEGGDKGGSKLIGKFWRWNSTGHVAKVEGVEDGERFTLRLPREVRNDTVTGMLSRTRSCTLIEVSELGNL